MSLSDPRGPQSRRRKGQATTSRTCLKCDKEFQAQGQYHICQPCTWGNRRLERIFGTEGVKAPSWWH